MEDKILLNEIKTIMDGIKSQNRETLEKQLFTMRTIHNIGREACSVADMENCLHMLVNRIAHLMSVEIISLMLMDEKKEELVIKLAIGLNEEIVRGAKVKIGESVAGWIAKSGEPLLIEDITKDGRFKIRNGKYYTNSLLSVPLKIRNRVIGVINVNNKTSRETFKEEDLEILMTVAEIASIAVENSRLREDVTALDKIKTEFVSNVSHELRTPLASIRESVNLILDELAGKINEDQKRFLELAKHNIDRLGRLIDDLLELAKLDAKRVIIKRELFDAAAIVNLAADSLLPLASEKGISFVRTVPDAKIQMWGDSDKITQAITNLVDNAIKYNKPRGRVTLKLEDLEETVHIVISDTGDGIPPDDVEKIFDRFYRVETALKSRVKGSGIGLAIVKEIVDAHGGKISVKSHIGKGSDFIIALPKDLRKREKCGGE